MPPRPIPADDLSEPLLARRIGTDDYAIDIPVNGLRRLAAGRNMRVARASGRTAWFWAITGPAAPEAGVGLAGEADDLEGARAGFRAAFDRLLYWASMANAGELRWNMREDPRGEKDSNPDLG